MLELLTLSNGFLTPTSLSPQWEKSLRYLAQISNLEISLLCRPAAGSLFLRKIMNIWGHLRIGPSLSKTARVQPLAVFWIHAKLRVCKHLIWPTVGLHDGASSSFASFAYFNLLWSSVCHLLQPNHWWLLVIYGLIVFWLELTFLHHREDFVQLLESGALGWHLLRALDSLIFSTLILKSGVLVTMASLVRCFWEQRVLIRGLSVSVHHKTARVILQSFDGWYIVLLGWHGRSASALLKKRVVGIAFVLKQSCSTQLIGWL